MAYDKELEARIDLISLNWPGFAKQRMFGGIAYLLQGNMAFGISKAWLLVRCGAATEARCLAEPGVQPFDLGGKRMTGWVMVAPEGCADDPDLTRWLERGRDFAAGLAPKPPRAVKA